MLLKQGDRGFAVAKRISENEKVAITFQNKDIHANLNCTFRLLSIPAVSLSRRQKDNYLAVPLNATNSILVSESHFTFEGAGPVSTRRYHKPGELVIFACHYKELVFAFQEATIVTYDNRNKEYLVRKQSYGGEVDDTFIVPQYCVYLPNWKHLHSRCRATILRWCLCAKRAGLVRDVIQLIAHQIWDFRDEQEWE